MDLAQVYWKAIHSDKVVDSKEEKAYTKVNRATLQKLIFYDDNQERCEFKRPEGVTSFAIRWRLRTIIDAGSSQVRERNWIIDDGKFNVLDESLKLHTHDSCVDCDKKPINITPVDLT